MNILKLPAVKVRTGLPRSTIYARMHEGTFPRSVSLGARSVGWLDLEINDWLSNQIVQSRELHNISR